MKHKAVGTWDEDGEKNVPHAEIVSLPVLETDDLPDGAVQMTWIDERGFTRQAHVVRWWRLDQQGIAAGVPLQVNVQARQRRDLSCPPHHMSAELMVTGNPDDKAQVFIGDPARSGSWAYGIIFHGASLTSTSVLIDT